MTHESPSPLVFRYLATGTPSTDTYFARGARGTRAWFDGFRDGEFLFAVPHIGLVDLDEAAYADAVRDHLTIAPQPGVGRQRQPRRVALPDRVGGRRAARPDRLAGHLAA